MLELLSKCEERIKSKAWLQVDESAAVSVKPAQSWVTPRHYLKVTRELFTAAATHTILRCVGSSGGGLPSACDLRVAGAFAFTATGFLPAPTGTPSK